MFNSACPSGFFRGTNSRKPSSPAYYSFVASSFPNMRLRRPSREPTTDPVSHNKFFDDMLDNLEPSKPALRLNTKLSNQNLNELNSPVHSAGDSNGSERRRPVRRPRREIPPSPVCSSALTLTEIGTAPTLKIDRKNAAFNSTNSPNSGKDPLPSNGRIGTLFTNNYHTDDAISLDRIDSDLAKTLFCHVLLIN